MLSKSDFWFKSNRVKEKENLEVSKESVQREVAFRRLIFDPFTVEAL
jgi:hypothetical protein